jgi:hypothetical protein
MTRDFSVNVTKNCLETDFLICDWRCSPPSMRTEPGTVRKVLAVVLEPECGEDSADAGKEFRVSVTLFLYV